MTYDTVIFTEVHNPTVASKPLGAYKIASMLRTHGYSVLVVDHISDWGARELIELLNSVVGNNTLFVGFSTTFFGEISGNPDNHLVYASDIKPIKINNSFLPQGKMLETALVNKIKSINPDCKIVLGGTTLGQDYNTSNRNVDIILRGISENIIIPFVNELKNKTPLTNAIKNIWGIVVVQDPNPETYDFSVDRMTWRPEDVVNARVLPFELSRGCIFDCKFCSYPMRGKSSYQEHTVNSNIVYEYLLENWERYGIRHYAMLDDTFNDSVDKLRDLHQAFKRLPFQPEFHAYVRLDLLSKHPEAEDLMFDMGWRAAFFGIESLDRKAASTIGKGYNADKLIDTIRRLRSKFGDDLHMHGNFMVGLPHETKQSIITTQQRILDQDIPLHSASFPALIIFKNLVEPSDIERNWHKYGYREVGNNPYIVEWANEHMTFNEALELQNRFQVNKQGILSCFRALYIWETQNFPEIDNNFASFLSDIKNPSPEHYKQMKALKQKFVDDYKKKLFELVRDN
jgi:hypothetical protein